MSIDTAHAVRIASTRIWRILLSTNGCRKLVGSRSLVRNATKPESLPASPIASLALAAFSATGPASKPEPGAMMFPAGRPSVSAMIVITRK